MSQSVDPQPKAPSARTIHIVEDDQSVRDALGILMRSEGYPTIEWSSGTPFCEQAHLSDQDIVVLDLGLPDIDGVDVVSALHQRGARPKFVIISGAKRSIFDAAIRSIQPWISFRKPLDVQEMVDWLRQHLKPA